MVWINVVQCFSRTLCELELAKLADKAAFVVLMLQFSRWEQSNRLHRALCDIHHRMSILKKILP